MRLIAIIVSGLLVAGCADAEPTADPPSTSSVAPAPPPIVNETAGSISGRVSDDEARPIPGVSVTLIETRAIVETDDAGRFTFNNLADASYGLVFTRVGFTQEARKVGVRAGEITEVNVVMKELVIEGPYYESIAKRAYIKNSYVFLTTFGSAANGTGLLSNFCDPCIFHLRYGKGLVEARGEAHWTASNNPAINNETFLQYYVGYTATSDGTAATTGYVKNRGVLPITGTGITAMSKENSTRLRVNGGFYSISLEHRPEIWTTFGYFGPLPETFTALPPP